MDLPFITNAFASHCSGSGCRDGWRDRKRDIREWRIHGEGLWPGIGQADGMHFVYQPLTGDGTIVARVVSSSGGQAAVMIRESLNANAADAYIMFQSPYIYFCDRASTGASPGQPRELCIRRCPIG